MAGAVETNAAERRRWNDEYWASVWPKREQMTNAVTEILLGHVGLLDGERVLDIGSGGGTTALAAAGVIGDQGRVTGADISTPLVDFARRRATDRQTANVSFVVADAQHETIPGGPFDVALSQFGVMFFDEPSAAFANIRHQLVPGGRLGFVCWQAVEKNPWWVGRAVAPYAPARKPPAPGKSATGPFSLSDPDRVGEILTASGWKTVERTPYELVVTVAREAIVDDEQLGFLGVSDDCMEHARQAVEAHLDQLKDGAGHLEAPLAVQVFTATA
jgi:SAM-dependent methyltransferase